MPSTQFVPRYGVFHPFTRDEAERAYAIIAERYQEWIAERPRGTFGPCRACTAPNRRDIDIALLTGVVFARVARMVSTTYSTLSLMKHRNTHLLPVLAGYAPEFRQKQAESLWQVPYPFNGNYKQRLDFYLFRFLALSEMAGKNPKTHAIAMAALKHARDTEVLIKDAPREQRSLPAPRQAEPIADAENDERLNEAFAKSRIRATEDISPEYRHVGLAGDLLNGESGSKD